MSVGMPFQLASEIYFTVEGPQLFLVGAELFPASAAVQTEVRPVGKSFRMFPVYVFPAQHQSQSCDAQRPCEEIPDHKQRREHEDVIPCIYPAADTAFVFHEPCLERTEEQYAYHIRY